MHPAMRRAARRVLGERYTTLRLARARWRGRRADPALDAAQRALVAAHGLSVSAGPFAGLRYPEAELADVHSVGAKLLGSYERELHSAVERLVALAPARVLNAGAGDGLYAVGLARRLPGATVSAFDIDERARRVTAAVARANGVAERVRVGARCSHAELDRATGAGSAVVCDIESGELELLDPERAPGLRGTALLVELHDHLDARITPALTQRFAATHVLELIDSEPRDPAAFPALAAVPAGQGARILDEHRADGMQWGLWLPRGAD